MKEMNPTSKLFLIISIILISGCYNVSEYSGDGNLIDNGVRAATNRYVLNLGSIDLSQRGSKTFRIINLPETTFVAGIKISVMQEDKITLENRLIKPTISLELTDEDGKVVFLKKSVIDLWTWSMVVNESRAFIYGREKPGTYFQVLPDSVYYLTLTVIEPDPSNINFTATLQAMSGGWK